MSNHVHLLVSPDVPPPRFLKSIKGYTAREANRLLQPTGEPFWQAESYVHWVRDSAEMNRIQACIKNNPVLLMRGNIGGLVRMSYVEVPKVWRPAPHRAGLHGATQKI
jgi:hypothetical protein